VRGRVVPPVRHVPKNLNQPKYKQSIKTTMKLPAKFLVAAMFCGIVTTVSADKTVFFEPGIGLQYHSFCGYKVSLAGIQLRWTSEFGDNQHGKFISPFAIDVYTSFGKQFDRDVFVFDNPAKVYSLDATAGVWGGVGYQFDLQRCVADLFYLPPIHIAVSPLVGFSFLTWGKEGTYVQRRQQHYSGKRDGNDTAVTLTYGLMVGASYNFADGTYLSFQYKFADFTDQVGYNNSDLKRDKSNTYVFIYSMPF